MPNPCATCVLGCCHRHTVNVSGYDVWVLAVGLELAPEQFLHAVPLSMPAKHGFLLDRSGTSYQIALQKRASDIEHKPCIFLLELPDHTGRCGVYALRPFVCQIYPAYLRNGIVGRRDDVVCPDDAWRDGALAQPIWYERLTHHFVEEDIYRLAVARWNYHVLHASQLEAITPSEYYAYLIEFYALLEPVRAQLSAATWQAMCCRWEACPVESSARANGSRRNQAQSVFRRRAEVQRSLSTAASCVRAPRGTAADRDSH